jgi:hypothetical protein
MLPHSAIKQFRGFSYRNEIVRSMEKNFCRSAKTFKFILKNTKQIQQKILFVCFRLLLYFLHVFRNRHWVWVMKCKGR